MAAFLPGGRGRGRPTADDQGGAKGAEAEVERLVEGDVGREEVGGGRGGLLGGELHGHLVPLLLVSPKTGTNKQNKK